MVVRCRCDSCLSERSNEAESSANLLVTFLDEEICTLLGNIPSSLFVASLIRREKSDSDDTSFSSNVCCDGDLCDRILYHKNLSSHCCTQFMSLISSSIHAKRIKHEDDLDLCQELMSWLNELHKCTIARNVEVRKKDPLEPVDYCSAVCRILYSLFECISLPSKFCNVGIDSKLSESARTSFPLQSICSVYFVLNCFMTISEDQIYKAHVISFVPAREEYIDKKDIA